MILTGKEKAVLATIIAILIGVANLVADFSGFNPAWKPWIELGVSVMGVIAIGLGVYTTPNSPVSSAPTAPVADTTSTPALPAAPDVTDIGVPSTDVTPVVDAPVTPDVTVTPTATATSGE
jgi:hypothetical protein